MKISYSTLPSNLNITIGFGYAGYNIIKSLQSLGYEVGLNSPDADVEINFCQPPYWSWHGAEYRIGYVPWESTILPENWTYFMNQVDEVWTTSDWIAEVFADNGVTRPIYVYRHGVDGSVWTPKRRTGTNKIRFLHVGEPSPRKGAQMAIDAFREAFGNSDEVSLTIKGHTQNTTRVYDRMGSIIGLPHIYYNNVEAVYEELSIEELVLLYHQHDMLVYPSYGEGFGFIPIQGMATGMPVITVPQWAPYRDYLIDELKIPARLGDSKWQHMHPGKMWHPDKASLVDIYRNSVSSFEELSSQAYGQVEDLLTEYDWESLTDEAFAQVRRVLEK